MSRENIFFQLLRNFLGKLSSPVFQLFSNQISAAEQVAKKLNINQRFTQSFLTHNFNPVVDLTESSLNDHFDALSDRQFFTQVLSEFVRLI